MANNNENNAAKVAQEQKPIELIRKFELAVYEEDVKDDGSVKWNQISYKQPVIIEARNPAELNEKLNLYKQCGQMAKVVREIDPPSKEQIAAYMNQQNAKTENNQATKNASVESNAESSQTQQVNPCPKTIPQVNARKPKYYKVGDVEIKDDNGKIYQKQWMKLSDTEASNIRLINDKNNALVNINGKHFEMKRWVLVETTESDESTQLEESLK